MGRATSGMRPATRIGVTATLAAALLAAAAAPAAEPGGAETPEALMAELKRAGQSQDIGAFVRSILPEERALLSFMLGVVPPEMAGAMMAGFAGLGPAEEQAEAQARVGKFTEAYEALLARYKIERIDPQGGLDLEDPAKAAAALDARLGHVDHAAFITDSMALLETLETPEAPSSTGEDGPMAQFQAEVESIQVEGDTAIVAIAGLEQKMQLKQSGGRWYLRLVPPGF